MRSRALFSARVDRDAVAVSLTTKHAACASQKPAELGPPPTPANSGAPLPPQCLPQALEEDGQARVTIILDRASRREMATALPRADPQAEKGGVVEPATAKA